MISGKSYTIQQKSSRRSLDAYEVDDHRVVTRTKQNNTSQLWNFTFLGRVYNLKQVSTGRFLDTHADSSKDFSAMTRKHQNNDSQISLSYSLLLDSIRKILKTGERNNRKNS